MDRRWRLLTPVALFCATLTSLSLGSIPAASANDDAPQLKLENHGAGKTHLLSPGQTAVWRVDARLTGGSAAHLSVQLRDTSSGAAAGLGNKLTLRVDACSTQWSRGSCSSGSHMIVRPTLLSQLSAEAIPLDPHAITRQPGLQLRVRATLDARADRQLQGETAHLELELTASGADSADTDSTSGGPNAPGIQAAPPSKDNEDFLADTGAGLGWSLALGIAAVGSGAALAAWASRRRSDAGVTHAE